jgi:hypothetical protein
MSKQRHRRRSQGGTSPETTPQTGSGVAHFSVSEVVQFSLSVDIWNAVHHTKTDKLFKRAPVIYLEFKFLIAKVKQLLENEHLVKYQRIKPLAPCIALALMRITFVKQWAE